MRAGLMAEHALPHGHDLVDRRYQTQPVVDTGAEVKCGACTAGGCPGLAAFVVLPMWRAVGGATREAMSLSRGRGHIRTESGRAIVVARCPLCGEEHRYDKGVAGGEDIESLRKVGYTDEWLPCQMDLPGNFWRIVITGGRQGTRPESPRRGRRTKGK